MRNPFPRIKNRLRHWSYLRQNQRKRAQLFRAMPGQTRHLSGPDPQAGAKTGEPVIHCLLRNGLPYIDLFLQHHRALGARHFIFLDNGSDDGTVERLRQEPQVCLMQTDMPFAGNDANIRAWMIEAWAGNSWTLVLDIDELFEVPHLDKIGLTGLTDYCDQTGADALLCHMLDMYPAQLEPGPDRPVIRADYPFFEMASMKPIPYQNWLHCRVPEGLFKRQGGVRARLFGTHGVHLSKACLIRPGRARRAYGNHTLFHARFADVSGALLHYKFLPSFHSRVADAVQRGNHWNGSAEYKQYQRLTADMAPIDMLCDQSQRYQNAEELVKQGLLLSSSGYVDFVDSRTRTPQAAPSDSTPLMRAAQA